MIDVLAQHLQDNGFGVVAQDLFINFLPDNQDNCICLFSYGGDAPDRDINRPGLQVRVRNKSDEKAEQKAYAIQNVLQNISNQTLGNLWFIHVIPRQSPEPLGRDSLNRVEYVQNYSVVYERGQ